MKFSYAALCVAVMTSSVEGFVNPLTTTSSRPSSLQLEAHNGKNLGSAFGGALVGWTLASQMAFAGMTTVPDQGKQAEDALSS